MIESRYYINLQIDGREEPFSYDVEKDEWDRLHRYMDSLSHIEGLNFFAFRDALGHTILVSVRDVVYFNLLFERGTYFPSMPTEEALLRIYFRNFVEPYSSSDLTADEITDFVLLMETAPDTKPFIQFTDEDGEVMYVNLHHVQLVDVPTAVVEQGMKLQEGTDQ